MTPDMTSELALNDNDKRRYARHLSLPDVGAAGQLRLQQAKVLVIGLGGLGNPVVTYLAAAGIGTLGLVDADVIELSNLQRQPLFTPDDIGKAKVDVAKERILKQNDSVNVNTYNEFLSVSNAIDIIKRYDLVIDGSDNLSVRYLINDACLLLNKTFVYGAIFRFSGQVSLFNSGSQEAACYRCLFPVNPDPGQVQDCNAGGVLGVLPGLVGNLQAIEAIKYLLDIGDTLQNRLLQLDTLKMQFSTISFTKNKDCCGCADVSKINGLDMPEYQANSVHVDLKIINNDALLIKAFNADQNICLLDVRNANELATKSVSKAVSNATHIPLTHIPLPELQQRISELDASQTYWVFCQSGKRAKQAVKILLENDFLDVTVIDGGVPELS